MEVNYKIEGGAQTFALDYMLVFNLKKNSGMNRAKHFDLITLERGSFQ